MQLFTIYYVLYYKLFYLCINFDNKNKNLKNIIEIKNININLKKEKLT